MDRIQPNFVCSTPVQNESSSHRIESNQLGIPFEKLIFDRPCLAAAMIGGWSTPTVRTPDLGNSRKVLSRSGAEKSESAVKTKPPYTPLNATRLCQSTKLRRRNAMTPSQIRLAKRRNWGASPLSSKRVDCCVIPNPSFATPTGEKGQRSERLSRKNSKAEFVYLPYNQDIETDASCVQQSHGCREEQIKTRRRNILKTVWQKLKTKKQPRRDVIVRKPSGDSKDLVLSWRVTPVRKFIRSASASRLEQYKLSPAPQKILRRNLTASRLRQMESVVQQDGIPLRGLLQSKTFTNCFREFLVREFSEENLDFWFDVEEYRRRSQDKLAKHARKIYETYLQPGSIKEVNVSANTRSKVEKELNSSQRTMYNEAQQQVYQLMQNDPFPRFIELCKLLKNN